MDNKLQDNFGTWKTDSSVIESDIQTLLFLATDESEPSVILTLWLPAQGEYVEKKIW